MGSDTGFLVWLRGATRNGPISGSVICDSLNWSRWKLARTVRALGDEVEILTVGRVTYYGVSTSGVARLAALRNEIDNALKG